MRAWAGMEGASVQLGALALDHPLLSLKALGQHAARHYSVQALGHLAKLVGSASLLGDPVRRKCPRCAQDAPRMRP